jgi:hypothetical protein
VFCIFCLTEKPPGNEHVFPLAIGGTLRTDRICNSGSTGIPPCNSTLGTVADAPLTNHLLIALRRWLNLPGNSGKVPDAVRMLLGEGVLASDPSQKIRLIENPKSGKIEPQISYSRREKTLPGGGKELQITIDASGGAPELRKILDRERKRAGLEPLSDAEANAFVEECLQNISTMNQPEVLYQFTFDTFDFQRGLFKIAYELAFLWLGERYLHDPTAATLRQVILGKIKPAEAGIRATIVFGGDFEPLKFWAEENDCHVAYSAVVNGTVAISLKVFDTFSACVVVTEEAGQYVRGQFDPTAIRFIHINPVSKEERQCAFTEEMGRIWHEIRLRKGFDRRPER